MRSSLFFVVLFFLCVCSVSDVKGAPPIIDTIGDNCNSAFVLDTLQFDGRLEKGLSLYTSGTINDYTPNAELMECNFATNPTVWYRTATQRGAKLVQVFLSARNEWSPKVSLYTEEQVGDGCSQLQVLKLNEQSCAASSGSTAAWAVTLDASQIKRSIPVWIAISTVDYLDSVSYDFDLEVFMRKCNKCPAIESDFCKKQNLNIELVARESDAPLTDSKILPGEKVSLCIQGDLGYEDGRLHGLTPRFGSGWDMDRFNPNMAEIKPSQPEWFDQSEDCASVANIDFRGLRTYTENNTLKFCHPVCEPCSFGSPVKKGDLLPSGWYYNENVGSFDCPENSCRPSDNLGRTEAGTSFEVCLDMYAKRNASSAEQKDLSIVFFPTTSQMTGCLGSRQVSFNDAIYLGAEDWEIDGVSSNARVEKSASFIAPNPVHDRLTLQCPHDAYIQVISIQGELVYEGIYHESLSVRHFPRGMYVLKIFDRGGVIRVERFVKI